MRFLLLVLLTAPAWAGKLPRGVTASDAQVVERAVGAMEQLVSAIFAVRGKCNDVAQAIKRTTVEDNQLYDELAAKLDHDSTKPIQRYSKKKYAARFKQMSDKLEPSTLGCRTHPAVADAWKQNKLLTESFGELPPEPPAKPADYGAKTMKLDAALTAYRAIATKMARTKRCVTVAKLVPRFATAKQRLAAAHDELDKPTQEIVSRDRDKDDIDATLKFTATRDRCTKNKRFARAVTRAGLDAE